MSSSIAVVRIIEVTATHDINVSNIVSIDGYAAGHWPVIPSSSSLKYLPVSASNAHANKAIRLICRAHNLNSHLYVDDLVSVNDWISLAVSPRSGSNDERLRKVCITCYGNVVYVAMMHTRDEVLRAVHSDCALGWTES